MSTCGYVCPKCEGKGFLEDGSVCDWCGEKEADPETTITNDDHNGFENE